VEPLLAVVLAARRPPTRRQLHAAALTLDPAMTANEFRRRLDALRKLLVPLPAGPDAAVAAAAAAAALADVGPEAPALLRIQVSGDQYKNGQV